jgi:hypothetical protein
MVERWEMQPREASARLVATFGGLHEAVLVGWVELTVQG